MIISCVIFFIYYGVLGVSLGGDAGGVVSGGAGVEGVPLVSLELVPPPEPVSLGDEVVPVLEEASGVFDVPLCDVDDASPDPDTFELLPPLVLLVLLELFELLPDEVVVDVVL
jgi:hypothetical protein